MRKMKKLFKIRNGHIPLFNWGSIHFILTTASLLIFIFTLLFTGITGSMCIWFIVSMAQYLPVFVVMASKYIFETILYKKVLTIIKRRLSELSIDIKDINIDIDDFNLHSCVLCVNYNENINHEIAIKGIVNQMNKNFGSGYHIIFTQPKV